MLVGLLLDQGLAGYSANRPSNRQVSVTLRRRLRILALRSRPGSITVTVTTTLCSSRQIRTLDPGRLRTLLTGSAALPAT
jgi:hypothetical protein